MAAVLEKQIDIRMKASERWLELSMAPLGEHEAGPYLYYPNQFHLDIEPTDELSRDYTLHNWESGILSGVFYASRKCKQVPMNWLIVRLEGRLGSESMDALAHAATVIVAKEAGVKLNIASPPGWIEE